MIALQQDLRIATSLTATLVCWVFTPHLPTATVLYGHSVGEGIHVAPPTSWQLVRYGSASRVRGGHKTSSCYDDFETSRLNRAVLHNDQPHSARNPVPGLVVQAATLLSTNLTGDYGT